MTVITLTDSRLMKALMTELSLFLWNSKKKKKPCYQSFCNINFSKINFGDYGVVQEWNSYRTTLQKWKDPCIFTMTSQSRMRINCKDRDEAWATLSTKILSDINILLPSDFKGTCFFCLFFCSLKLLKIVLAYWNKANIQ